jgi:ABC-type polysaccharide/polyol phosphate transport system ATPase subunit
MNKDIAISVKNVSKTFKIPHEKVNSVRGAVVSAFKKKNYEEFKALDNVSFEVKKGEFFGIIGRNGSGKSTLLKILAGIYQADAGKVSIDGRISPFLELGIGFNPELSGRDNVYLNATVLGLTKKEIDKKFDSIVDFSELERFIDQKLKNYSSGMQVRLAFSVSIHANREILLMDEVLAVGDTNFQNKCLKEFAKYKNSGKTVILVTHDIEAAQKYCDRLMLIRNGKIERIGSPQDVVNEYINQNIIDVTGDVENKKESRIGNKKAEIVSYQFLNHQDEISDELESGNNFKVVLRVKFKENVSNPTFGVMFKDSTNSIHWGLHSLYSRNPLKLENVNSGEEYEIIFDDEMILAPGAYSVLIACSNQESYLKYEPLDILNNALNIKVFSGKQFWGMINSDLNTSIKKL